MCCERRECFWLTHHQSFSTSGEDPTRVGVPGDLRRSPKIMRCGCSGRQHTARQRLTHDVRMAQPRVAYVSDSLVCCSRCTRAVALRDACSGPGYWPRTSRLLCCNAARRPSDVRCMRGHALREARTARDNAVFSRTVELSTSTIRAKHPGG